MSEDLVLHDAVVFLIAAGLVIPLAQRLRINPVLSFLLIGLAIGPFGLARFTAEYPWLQYLLITDVSGVRALAELGVIFLLFMIGMELSPERLWRMRREVFGLGSAQILTTAVVIGGISWAFGNTASAAIVLGGCLALSSTAVVMQLLMQQARFGDPAGRGSFAILLAQDIAVVPLLFLVGMLSAPQGTSLLGTFGLAVGQAVIAVAVIMGIGRLLVRPAFHFVGAQGTAETFMAITLLAIVGTAAATHSAGLSASLGAFLAGLLLAETEFRHEIEVSVEPFKGLLLGLFFMAVGMGIDLKEIGAAPGWVLASVIGLFTLKASITAILGRLFGFSWPVALEMGLLLGQGGEFAFVVVGLALAGGLLPAETAQFMLIVVGATLFATPIVARLARLLVERLPGKQSAPETLEDLPELSGHVIIVGYGRTGALLTSLLSRQQVPYIALDMNAQRVADHRAAGVQIFAGNAARAAMLERLGLERASAIAICTDDPGATEQVLAATRRVSKDVPVVARARDGAHAATLLQLGASRVVPELLESGLQLGTVLFEEVGLSAIAARDLVEIERAHHMLGISGRQPEQNTD